MERIKNSYLLNKIFLVAVIIIYFKFSSYELYSQPLASGHDKFIGNVHSGNVNAKFTSYWNQVTPENSGKWQYAEPSRDSYSWGGLDAAYNFALDNGFPYKHHTLIWGQQYPSWITTLSAAEQAEEVEEWIKLVGERYPLMDYCDVVNEPLAGHAPAPYRNALGGAGTTGYDWVIWAFEKARIYMPNTKLILNDYNIINSDGSTNELIKIANLLKARNLIDGIGIQGHRFELETVSTTTLKNNLDKLAATGLPVYITEFDLGNVGNSGTPNDQVQLDLYKKVFPLLWEHPGVKGITFWGWIQNQIWQETCYLIRSDGTERPAMVWLRNYLAEGNYKSYASGNWNDVNTWQWNNGDDWIHPAPSIPTLSSNPITIQEGHDITLTASDSIDQLTIGDGGSLIINEGVELIVKNGNGIDLAVYGSIVNQGTVTPEDSAEIKFMLNGSYNHLQDAGTIPTAVWAEGSTCLISGVVSKAPSNANQDFFNVAWDCPNQTGNYNLGWNGNTIGGSISIVNTGSGRLYLCGPSANSSAELTIEGDIIQMGGAFATNGTGNAGTSVIVNHNGNINVTGGNFSISRGSQGGTGTAVWYINKGNVSLSNATTQNSNSAGGKFVFAGKGTAQTLTIDNVTFGSGGFPVEVDSGAVLDMGLSVLRGNGKFILKDGATLQTANPSGIDSSIVNSGEKILGKAASYVFSGSSTQVTGSQLPDTVANLVIKNSASGSGVTLSGNVVVNGTLDMNSGALNLGGNKLIYGTNGSLKYSGSSAQTTADAELPSSGGPANIIITNTRGVDLHASRKISNALELSGKLRLGNNNLTASSASSSGLTRYVVTDGTGSLRLHPGQSEILYPVGTATAYAGVWIANEGEHDTIGVRLESDTSPAPKGGRVNVKWLIDESVEGGGDYTLKFDWVTLLENNVFRGDRAANAKIFNLTDSTEAGTGDYTTQFSSQPYSLKRGGIETLGWFGVGLFGTVTDVQEEEQIPNGFYLSQNYPNPFNPSTVISYQIAPLNLPQGETSVHVTLIVYDVLGKEIAALVDGYQSPGVYKVTFDGRQTNGGSQLTSGIYFYMLKAGNNVMTKKMLLLK